jgi:hypothetical protein
MNDGGDGNDGDKLNESGDGDKMDQRGESDEGNEMNESGESGESGESDASEDDENDDSNESDESSERVEIEWSNESDDEAFDGHESDESDDSSDDGESHDGDDETFFVRVGTGSKPFRSDRWTSKTNETELPDHESSMSGSDANSLDYDQMPEQPYPRVALLYEKKWPHEHTERANKLYDFLMQSFHNEQYRITSSCTSSQTT